MPRRHILHLGLHKTATTSLQDFLAGQSHALLAAGVRYWPLARMRSDVTPLMTHLGAQRRAQLRGLIEGVRQPTLLLSDENILGGPADVVQGELYPHARNRIETYCRERAGEEIVLFVTLREPHAFLVSLYCEYLRHNPFVSFARYAEAFDPARFSYAEILGWLFRLPRGVRARAIPFERERGGGAEAVARALVGEACGPGHGVDFAAFPKARSRAAFSVEELETAAQIAGRADAQTARFFLNMLDGRRKRFGSTRFAPLDPEFAARLEARYEADLAAFAEAGMLARPAEAA